MHVIPSAVELFIANIDVLAWLGGFVQILKVLVGFSVIIFFHELGHYLACRWVDVRVHRFAVGFGKRICGFRKGEGFTFGSRPNYTRFELEEKKFGETDYSLMALPIGGYVKMEDHDINEETGEIIPSPDPRAFSNRSVGKRAIILSAGVIFNVLLAGLLFILVFMIGKPAQAPIIGQIDPSGPAAGKLQSGDRILAIDGDRVSAFVDILMAAALADGPLTIEVERDGQRLDAPVVVQPMRYERMKINSIGVDMMASTVAGRAGIALPGKENLQPRDIVTHVDGKPVESGLELAALMRASMGKVLELTVQRPEKSGPNGSTRTVTVYQRAALMFGPVKTVPEGYDRSHLLGFIRRQCVGGVVPGENAEKAGFQVGDLIDSWEGIPNPTHTEIIAAIQRNADKPNKVIVERSGEAVALQVKPKRPFKLIGKRENALVGLQFFNGVSNDVPRVVRLVPDTPAYAAFGDLRGFTIRKIGGTSVGDWGDASDALRLAAGTTVPIEIELAGNTSTVQMRIPGSIVNETLVDGAGVGLPRGAEILSIDGHETFELKGEKGAVDKVGVRNNPNGLAQVLATKVGQNVTVAFRERGGPTATGRFAVRPDNLDPWQQRVVYEFDDTTFLPVRTTISAQGNPLTATVLAAQEVKRMVFHVYQSMTAMVQRRVGTENVAGPIGIMVVGVAVAESSFSELIAFLALLSINLAVLNLLPIPILDGGHLLFLLIEKIKGTPVSFNVRLYTGLIGLAAILLIAIFVTVQDIATFVQRFF